MCECGGGTTLSSAESLRFFFARFLRSVRGTRPVPVPRTPAALPVLTRALEALLRTPPGKPLIGGPASLSCRTRRRRRLLSDRTPRRRRTKSHFFVSADVRRTRRLALCPRSPSQAKPELSALVSHCLNWLCRLGRKVEIVQVTRCGQAAGSKRADLIARVAAAFAASWRTWWSRPPLIRWLSGSGLPLKRSVRI